MKNTLQRLTIIVSVLAGGASFGGLVIPNLYRDTPLYKAAWQANDLITLLLAPALFLSYHYYRRGSVRAHLVWLGLLLYMFYNYAFYLFGAAFNWFFLIYAAVFTLSLYALLFGLQETSGTRLPDKQLTSGRRWLITIFFILVAFPLAAVELSQYVRFISSGLNPEIPPLIMALDLTLVIPNTILAAWLLAARRRWGTVLTVMMLVKSFTYGMVLVTGTTFIAATDIAPWDPLLPFYIFVSAGGLLLLLILLKELTTQNSTGH